MFLMWKGHVIMHAQDACKLRFFSHYDCQGMSKADSAIASFSPWVAHLFAFQALSKLVVALVTDLGAKVGRHGQVTWSVSSRDRMGKHSSLACPSRFVTTDVYSIALPDSQKVFIRRHNELIQQRVQKEELRKAYENENEKDAKKAGPSTQEALLASVHAGGDCKG